MRCYKSTMKWYRTVDVKPPVDPEETPGPLGEIYSKWVYVTDGEDGEEGVISVGRYIYNWNEHGLRNGYRKKHNWYPPEWEPDDNICFVMSPPGYWCDEVNLPPYIEKSDSDKED